MKGNERQLLGNVNTTQAPIAPAAARGALNAAPLVYSRGKETTTRSAPLAPTGSFTALAVIGHLDVGAASSTPAMAESVCAKRDWTLGNVASATY